MLRAAQHTSSSMLGTESKTRKTSSQKGATGQGSSQDSALDLGHALLQPRVHVTGGTAHIQNSGTLYLFSIHSTLTKCLRSMPRWLAPCHAQRLPLTAELTCSCDDCHLRLRFAARSVAYRRRCVILFLLGSLQSLNALHDAGFWLFLVLLML